MKIWDVYSFLWDLKEAIGDNCLIGMDIPADGLMRFTVNWPDDGLQYVYEVSAKFLEHMNIETFTKLVSEKVNVLYKIKTVGEE